MKNRTRLLLALVSSLIASLTTLPTRAAEPFPAKPVTLVSAFAAGSGPDAVLRLVSDKLGKAWNQRVLVDNRPGGGGFIAMDAAKFSDADGVVPPRSFAVPVRSLNVAFDPGPGAARARLAVQLIEDAALACSVALSALLPKRLELFSNDLSSRMRSAT